MEPATWSQKATDLSQQHLITLGNELNNNIQKTSGLDILSLMTYGPM